MHTLRGLSLFSGIGGLDLAFEWAGGRVSAMCELEPYCQKVLRHHWPDVPLFEDIRELRGSDVGAVDVIYGGFPCQPFSVAGNKKGKNDSRYLWPEFSRLVGEIRPRWVVAENVPGILRIAADDVCADLERQGYTVGIWDFEAAAVGAQHRRERIFFVAHAGRTLRQGISETRDFRGSPETRNAPAVERSGSSHVTDPDEIRRDMRGLEGQGIQRGKPARHEADTGCETPTDTNSTGREEQRGPIAALPQFRLAECGGGWESEPGVGRVVNGIPHRVDRLRALGNAVVPQQAYPIFRAIMEQEGWE